MPQGDIPESLKEEFSELIGIMEKVFDRLVGKEREKLNEERHQSFIHGYNPPYGLGNIWGVGVGYKGFLSNDLSEPKTWEFWHEFLHLAPHPHSLRYREFERLFSRHYEFEECIKIFVGKKARKNENVKKEFLVSEIKSELGYRDIPTEIVEVHHFMPSSAIQVTAPTSGGNVGLRGGTIGSIVEGPKGDDVMLSCAHVFVDIGNKGERRIVQPSVAHQTGGGMGTVIGDWSNFHLNMNTTNEIDSAIADFSKGVNYQRSKFSGVRDPKRREEVWKEGAFSGRTEGVVNSPLIKIPSMPYKWGYADFDNCYTVGAFREFWPGNSFAIGGDSGSIVQSTDSEALGMIIGTSPKYGNDAIVCRTITIENLLHVKF